MKRFAPVHYWREFIFFIDFSGIYLLQTFTYARMASSADTACRSRSRRLSTNACGDAITTATRHISGDAHGDSVSHSAASLYA